CSLHQVKQREQENPDHIDKVPVEAGQFQHHFVLASESAQKCHDQNDGENHQPAEHVQGMKARHREVTRSPQIAERNYRRQVQIVILLEQALDLFSGFVWSNLGPAILQLQLLEQVFAILHLRIAQAA